VPTGLSEGSKLAPGAEETRTLQPAFLFLRLNKGQETTHPTWRRSSIRAKKIHQRDDTSRHVPPHAGANYGQALAQEFTKFFVNCQGLIPCPDCQQLAFVQGATPTVFDKKPQRPMERPGYWIITKNQ